MRIPSSDLIINQDGSIYHLGLQPGELAPLIITVGDPDRVPLVSQYFDEIDFKTFRREFVTHTGRIGNKKISVLSTGMGTDNIDIVLNEIDALFNIDFESKQIKKQLTSLKIIRLGTSGTIQQDIPLGSILASELAIDYDGLLSFYELPPHRFSNFKLPLLNNRKAFIAPSSELLLDTIAKEYIKGITYTAVGFYAPQGRLLRAKPSLPNLLDQLRRISFPKNRKITNIEMETSGLYGLGHILGHEMLSISVILADRVNGKFLQQPEKAIQNMLEDCLEKITTL
ncbi:MAG TPA: nucleoside phosphorylase [Chitinophagales bacterium]|nr:nucleoside phosphorylase [Chitinophagales bacterium]